MNKTGNKEYKLKKWYPSLYNDFKVGDVVFFDKKRGCYAKPNNRDTVLRKREVENNPDFWEEVKETLKSKGKRVMRYDAYSGEPWHGTIISETANSYVVVPDDDVRPTVRWDKVDCELAKERMSNE